MDIPRSKVFDEYLLGLASLGDAWCLLMLGMPSKSVYGLISTFPESESSSANDDEMLLHLGIAP